ncbi:MAG TPA: hypothetical protein VNO14_14835, partial [Blastocatellia bacterium]|nr:hypothetical protein [Blastocatellia bacterium]
MNRRPVHLIAILLLLSLAGGDLVFAQRSRSRSKRPAVTKKRKTARKRGRASRRRRARTTARSRRSRRARDKAEAAPAAA